MPCFFRREIDGVPLDFISSVHRLTSSWTSSGSTEVRAHASVHRGFAGCWSWSAFAPFFLDLPSLPLRRVNMPIVAQEKRISLLSSWQ